MNGKRVLGLIPARGGSKGIPLKNIAPIAGKPLIGWVCEAALKCKLLDEIALSSDSDEIIEVVRSYGIDAPFKRPPELALDESLVIDVIKHALQWYERERNQKFDFVCLLQPTAPLADTKDYNAAVELAIEKNADTVISVYRCGVEHPALMHTREADGRCDWFVKNLGWNRMARRQDLPPVYMRCGVVYVFKSSMILTQNTLYGGEIYSIEVPRNRAVDINEKEDLQIAEIMLQSLQTSER